MSVNKEQLNRLRDILSKEYGRSLSDEELLSEALRLYEFAKTILRFKLSNNKK
jgi:hypothetical protein